jgi:PH (Pleckstrin Homology) domain-containing protein
VSALRTNDAEAQETITFAPSPSFGWLSLLLVALLVLIPGILGALASLRLGVFALVPLLPALIVGVPLLLLVIWFPTMHYVLDRTTLTLRCGPFLTYRIPLAEIDSVQRRNLEVSVWASLRVPGLALFTVPYADVGKVKMCATRAAERIVLIRTKRDRYGVTPADEKAFLAALHARLG